tara:strand:+ start:220 stop:435 length:216 start_codon:yes stop_codon:yes gene_type:complete
MSDIVNMGGHGGYIWAAWGIALVVLAVLVAASVKSMRARERELARLEAEAPRRRRRGNTPEAGSETGRENG